jgi:hypothetical protein
MKFLASIFVLVASENDFFVCFDCSNGTKVPPFDQRCCPNDFLNVKEESTSYKKLRKQQEEENKCVDLADWCERPIKKCGSRRWNYNCRKTCEIC